MLQLSDKILMAQYKKLSELIGECLKQKQGTHIYFLRHGQSMANHTGSVVGWTDSRLSIKGRSQSNSLFKSFHPHISCFTSLHSSDLSRCKESLELSLGFSQRKVSYSTQLRELNFGDHQGVHYDSMEKEEKKVMSSIQYQAPNGENWIQAKSRAIEYLNHLGKGHHLISTHGGLICALTYHLGIKQVLPNCSVIAAQHNKQDRDLSKINFQWRFEEI